jgi:hypothetical protein
MGTATSRYRKIADSRSANSVGSLLALTIGWGIGGIFFFAILAAVVANEVKLNRAKKRRNEVPEVAPRTSHDQAA